MSDSDTSGQGLPGLVPEAAQKDEDQIQEPADTEEANSKHPDQTGTDLAHIESMYTQPTQEQTKEERCPLALMDVPESADVPVYVVIVIYYIDHRLLILGLRRSISGSGTAVGAELGIGSNFFSAIFTIHTNSSLLFSCVRFGHLYD